MDGLMYGKLGENYFLRYNDRIYLFDMGGKFLRECEISACYQNVCEVSGISVLTHKNGQEMCVSVGKHLKRFNIDNSDKTLLNSNLISKNGFIVTLLRKVEQEGVRATQALYIYPKNTNMIDYLFSLMKEITGVKEVSGV